MLFKKKQAEPQKPNKIKIEMSLERCKDSIQGLLDQYEKNEQDYMRKMVAMKKEGRLSEANRYKEKLRLVFARQAKMNDLLDQVEQFGYMIDEAFAKNDVYQSLGMVLGEANKVSVSPELKKLLADVKQFEEVFTKGLNKMDSVFGKVSRTVSDVNDSTTNTFDAEIEARVNARIEQADQQTTMEAEADKSVFDDVLSFN
ncbi:MAG: hypothetical protein IKC37_00150 [Clostridia bacterium]|nr:hypothetical protein [Clostridia bacterium]